MHRSAFRSRLIGGLGWVSFVLGAPMCRSGRFFHFLSFVAPLGLGGQVAAAGGPLAAVSSACRASSHGQCWGRWRRVRRADRAIRAGTVMSWARMVAVVALAWNLEARVPAARVRLNAIVARTSHAAFALIRPDGILASGP